MGDEQEAMKIAGLISVFVLLMSIPIYSGPQNPPQYTYKLSPDSTYVDHVTYDKNLNVVRINVHAVVGFGFIKINIDEWYGILVKDPKDVEKKIKEILGDVKIVHLTQSSK